MELATGTTPLEERKVTLALPPEIWEILDGTNEMALAGNGQGFEHWVADMIMSTVARCLDIALSHTCGSHYNCGSPHNGSPEGNA